MNNEELLKKLLDATPKEQLVKLLLEGDNAFENKTRMSPKKVTPKAPPPDEVHGSRVLVRRLRGPKGKRGRVEVRCLTCDHTKVLTRDAWERGNCPSCVRKNNKTPEPQNDEVDNLTSLLSEHISQGQSFSFTVKEWSELLGYKIDLRWLGKMFSKLSETDSPFKATKDGRSKWKVRRE